MLMAFSDTVTSAINVDVASAVTLSVVPVLIPDSGPLLLSTVGRLISPNGDTSKSIGQ